MLSILVIEKKRSQKVTSRDTEYQYCLYSSQILAKLDKRSASPHATTPEESEKSRYPKIIPGKH